MCGLKSIKCDICGTWRALLVCFSSHNCLQSKKNDKILNTDYLNDYQ